ncbi:hypothetical protein C8R46DRAFT_1064511 [Mycena filopes]|nr:hypothetical protein C8R46DRAFT_1064511 [Mycena filopes]
MFPLTGTHCIALSTFLCFQLTYIACGTAAGIDDDCPSSGADITVRVSSLCSLDLHDFQGRPGPSSRRPVGPTLRDSGGFFVHRPTVHK